MSARTHSHTRSSMHNQIEIKTNADRMADERTPAQLTAILHARARNRPTGTQLSDSGHMCVCACGTGICKLRWSTDDPIRINKTIISRSTVCGDVCKQCAIGLISPFVWRHPNTHTHKRMSVTLCGHASTLARKRTQINRRRPVFGVREPS